MIIYYRITNLWLKCNPGKIVALIHNLLFFQEQLINQDFFPSNLGIFLHQLSFEILKFMLTTNGLKFLSLKFIYLLLSDFCRGYLVFHKASLSLFIGFSLHLGSIELRPRLFRGTFTLFLIFRLKVRVVRNELTLIFRGC